jgi:hypothetical protein
MYICSCWIQLLVGLVHCHLWKHRRHQRSISGVKWQDLGFCGEVMCRIQLTKRWTSIDRRQRRSSGSKGEKAFEIWIGSDCKPLKWNGCLYWKRLPFSNLSTLPKLWFGALQYECYQFTHTCDSSEGRIRNVKHQRPSWSLSSPSSQVPQKVTRPRWKI